jgi:beta-glucosidase/6-phospho-beta-glucosidase/beta-galactosidase
VTRMNWDAVKRDRARYCPGKVERIPVKADQSFWRAWRDDTEGMKRSGYRVFKVGRQWVAYIERERRP